MKSNSNYARTNTELARQNALLQIEMCKMRAENLKLTQESVALQKKISLKNSQIKELAESLTLTASNLVQNIKILEESIQPATLKLIIPKKRQESIRKRKKIFSKLEKIKEESDGEELQKLQSDEYLKTFEHDAESHQENTSDEKENIGRKRRTRKNVSYKLPTLNG